MDYHLDAKNKILGRLASEIALILQGKKHPGYDPRLAGGDRVFVRHAESVVLTGRKFKQKVYHRHTGYMGHLKTQSFAEAMSRDPEKVLRETVRRMLPKNFLSRRRLNNLRFEHHAE